MKILFVSDGKYPEYTNGVAIYLYHFLRELKSNGVEVSLLHVCNSRFKGHPVVRPSKSDGIRYLEIKNSPLFMGDGLENPVGCLFNPELERVFTHLLRADRPDVVHIHELHRMPASIIHIAKSHNLPVVVTFHDYWFICPLFQLFTPQETVCEGPDGGRNCVLTCLAGDPVTRLYRRYLRIFHHTIFGNILRTTRNVYKTIRKEPLWQTTRFQNTCRNPRNLKLGNRINNLAKREFGLKQALLEADVLHAVSHACARIYRKQLSPGRPIQILQLGLPTQNQLTPKVKKFDDFPLKVGFLGHLGPSKGAQLLLEAAAGFRPRDVEFHFHGKARSEDVNLLRQYAGKSKNIFYHGPYRTAELEQILDSIHLLVVPSLWVETLALVGLEAQSAGVPVIASNDGGMCDYVKDGENGILFQQGSVSALSACLRSILDLPAKIEQMSRRAIEPLGMKEHSDVMLQLYRNVSCP
jgi:glycosyltransferase involved in cell wall biosynthesis